MGVKWHFWRLFDTYDGALCFYMYNHFKTKLQLKYYLPLRAFDILYGKMIFKKNYKNFEICAKICKPLYIRRIHYTNPKKNIIFVNWSQKIRKGQLRRKRLKANGGTWHRLPSFKNDEFGRYDTMRTYPMHGRF